MKIEELFSVRGKVAVAFVCGAVIPVDGGLATTA